MSESSIISSARRAHVSVNEKILHVMKRLAKEGHCEFSGLFDHAESRNEIVATFLAVLELIKGKRILVTNLSEDGEHCEALCWYAIKNARESEA